MATNLYVKVLTTFEVATDSDNTDKRANWSEYVTEATSGSNASKSTAGKTAIADAGTLNVAFGPVTTAKYVFVKSDRQVTLQFNGDSNGVAIGVAADKPGFLGIPTSCTSLSITNASGAEAEVEYELVGV